MEVGGGGGVLTPPPTLDQSLVYSIPTIILKISSRLTYIRTLLGDVTIFLCSVYRMVIVGRLIGGIGVG